MAKKRLPQPQRSQFDQTELLQRLASIERRLNQLEDRVIFGDGIRVGGSAGGPAHFGGSGVRI